MKSDGGDKYCLYASSPMAAHAATAYVSDRTDADLGFTTESSLLVGFISINSGNRANAAQSIAPQIVKKIQRTL